MGSLGSARPDCSGAPQCRREAIRMTGHEKNGRYPKGPSNMKGVSATETHPHVRCWPPGSLGLFPESFWRLNLLEAGGERFAGPRHTPDSLVSLAFFLESAGDLHRQVSEVLVQERLTQDVQVD